MHNEIMLRKSCGSHTLKIATLLGICLVLIVTQSGCSTLGQATGGVFNLVGTLVGGTFKVIGKVLDIVAKMPKPPPGVF